jgi:hypothetical protein
MPYCSQTTTQQTLQPHFSDLTRTISDRLSRRVCNISTLAYTYAEQFGHRRSNHVSFNFIAGIRKWQYRRQFKTPITHETACGPKMMSELGPKTEDAVRRRNCFHKSTCSLFNANIMCRAHSAPAILS